MKNLKNCSPLTNVANDDEFKAFINSRACQKLPERDQSMKADAGKPMLELIPQSLYRDLGAVLTFGANKYGPNTWQDVDVERYIGALLRHLYAYREDPYGVDADSGLPHTAHLLANACFINDIATRVRESMLKCQE